MKRIMLILALATAGCSLDNGRDAIAYIELSDRMKEIELNIQQADLITARWHSDAERWASYDDQYAVGERLKCEAEAKRSQRASSELKAEYDRLDRERKQLAGH